MSRLNKTNVEVEKRMPMLNKRSIEFEKRRSYVKTTNKLNFDWKNALYSCFEKGCPTKPCATMPIGIMGSGGLWYLIRCFSDIEGNITNKSLHAFSFLAGQHREPQSMNAKLFVTIIPIGIVAYALTLLWDNLCRNSCIFMAL